MKVSELEHLCGAVCLTGEYQDREIACGYTCDLLSHVMGRGQADMAWITVQTHMNVVAVAVLAEMACVIMPEDIDMEQASLEKAQAEGLCVLKSPLSAYAICGRMAAAGVPARGGGHA